LKDKPAEAELTWAQVHAFGRRNAESLAGSLGLAGATVKVA
jgi:hypothetical protein